MKLYNRRCRRKRTLCRRPHLLTLILKTGMSVLPGRNITSSSKTTRTSAILIQRHIQLNSSVLELGCGNSQLCEELYRDGITDVTCIDLSSVAVEKKKHRLSTKGYKEVKVLEADILDAPFQNECFDVVIEKGTMGLLFVDSVDPWKPNPETVGRVMAMLQNVHRVQNPEGILSQLLLIRERDQIRVQVVNKKPTLRP